MLHDFRVKTIPPEHPLYDDERATGYRSDLAGIAADVEKLNAAHERETSRSSGGTP